MMTITTFMSILTVGILMCSLLTEAIKKTYAELDKKCSPNIIALIDAFVVGIFGTSVVYSLTGIPFTTNNILCMILMAFAIWLGATVGYDKVIQTIAQIQSVLDIKNNK